MEENKKNMGIGTEDDMVLGEILLDKKTGEILFNIPLLGKLNPTTENLALLQKSVDLVQEFMIKALLSDKELEELKDKCVEELKAKKENLAKDVVNNDNSKDMGEN
ncbi:MAG: hypothetical protein J6J36_00400 [Clostridia bacterium]|nr:hypothetical protein [Clostridia bacterium]